MREFVGDDDSQSLTISCRRLGLVVQENALSVSDESPVLHSTGTKLRNADVI